MTHGTTKKPEDRTGAPGPGEATSPYRSTRTRRSLALRSAAAVLLLAGQPAGCVIQEDGGAAEGGSELSSDIDRAEEPFSTREDLEPAVAGSELGEAADRFNEQLPRLKEIQERFATDLFANEGVNSLGIGLADDGTTPIFRVVVANPELLETLPREVEGVAIEIDVGEPVRLLDGGPTCNAGAGPPCHTDPQPFPVEMGNSGAWILGTACTLGFKACDLDTGNSVLVTNSHCAQYSVGCALAPPGISVRHPGPLDLPPGDPGLNIGTIAGHAAPSCDTLGNFTDATKVTSAFFQTSKDHRDIGAPKHEISGLVPGTPVQYSGRSSGRNTGVVTAVNVMLVVPPPEQGGFCCGSLLMLEQISFAPTYPILGGDSGSGVLINKRFAPLLHRRIAGLLFASDGAAGYFNDIDNVLSALNLTLDFTECGFPSDY